MSPSDLIGLAAFVVLFALGAVVIVLFAYGAVWAFRIRRALMSPLFQERALWVGVVAITFGVLVSSNLLIRYFASDNFYLTFSSIALLTLLEY